ncbi:MAG TPA: cupin domain-containing protein [Bryobacteraceae bacterium]|jgi:mannose-6-phosphate isomerase-like protein (cupin superfamily)|nr:cupin domain-containing protein [Bryobacteraceae bacterium]
MNSALRFLGICAAASALAFAADPTYLHRYVPDVTPVQDDLTANANGSSYRPVFGIGDSQAKQPKGIARYGELTVERGGSSAIVSYPKEEQIYYVLDGNGMLVYGDQQVLIKKNDFMYLPVGVSHGVANKSDQPLRVLVMGFKIPPGVHVTPTPKLMLANTADVPYVLVSGHGPTVHFQLLMGTTGSKRDKLAAASQMVSLFIMDFAPGGTNIPHHHEIAEEIYYILRGHGDMVAGGGEDGNEGRHPAKAGDAYFIRLNATVGFYSGSQSGEHDQVLAVRSRYPFPQKDE